MSKQLPPPPGGHDLEAMLRARRARTDDARPVPAPAPPEPRREPPAAPPRPARAKTPPMDRRSWYMPAESADALAAAIEELHFTERAPKHAVLAALIDVALDHLDDVRARIQRAD